MSTAIRRIMGLAPVIPVITLHKLEHALPLGEALVAGGLVVLEVTLRTEAALACIGLMAKKLPHAVVGAGTLTRPEHFTQCAAQGVQFAVTPGLTPALAEAAARSDYPLLPGIMTPSELIAARALGFSACKLFPAQQAGGIGMLKALGAVFPDVVFCPTGGVSRQNAGDFLALPNVLCVGGSWVVPQSLIDAGDWAGIETLARDAATLARPPAAPRPSAQG